MENQRLRNASALYEYVKAKIVPEHKCYILIDEIQYVDGFEDLVNTLKNHGHDVYITGSNSKLLSSDISTRLRGRSIEIQVHTLSFNEFYNYKGGDAREAYEEYQLYGGFPYLVSENDISLKLEYLKMLEDTIVTKDVIDRYNIRNQNLFSSVYSFLSSSIGSIISGKKIVDTLISNGFKTISPDAVLAYLDYLCQSFLFYKVYRYDIKGKAYLKTLNKYYASDIGLRNSRLIFRQIEASHTMENIVYLELINRGYLVDIGKNNEKEINFIARNSRDTYYIQVALNISTEEKRHQETSSFRGLDDGYKKNTDHTRQRPFPAARKRIPEDQYNRFPAQCECVGRNIDTPPAEAANHQNND